MKVLLVVALVLQGLAAQSGAASRHTEPEWLPLRLNARWEYRERGGARIRTVECAAVQRCGDRTWWFLITRQPEVVDTELWGAFEDGIYAQPAEPSWNGRKQPTPLRIVALPLGITWRWGVHAGNADSVCAELVAMRDRVVVPAGEYEVPRLRVPRPEPDVDEDAPLARLTRWDTRVAETTLWPAAGVGFVRVDERDSEREFTIWELVRFTPGESDADWRRSTRVLAALGRNPRWSRGKGTVTLCHPATPELRALPLHVYRVGDGTDAVTLLVDDRDEPELRVLDLRSADDWNLPALLPLPVPARLRACARLIGMSLAIEELSVSEPIERAEGVPGRRCFVAEIAGKTQSGRAWSMDVKVRATGQQIVAVGVGAAW